MTGCLTAQRELTWSRVGDGGCRHCDGNADAAAAAVLPAAATPAAPAEDRRERTRGHRFIEGDLLGLPGR